jgi:hypothetical protein
MVLEMRTDVAVSVRERHPQLDAMQHGRMLAR